MSYEYPFDDDRDVTVGDLRIAHGSIQASIEMATAHVLLAIAVGCVIAEMPLAGLAAVIGAFFLFGLSWVRVIDGRLRALVSRYHDFGSPPLNDAEFGERRQPVRGDD